MTCDRNPDPDGVAEQNHIGARAFIGVEWGDQCEEATEANEHADRTKRLQQQWGVTDLEADDRQVFGEGELHVEGGNDQQRCSDEQRYVQYGADPDEPLTTELRTLYGPQELTHLHRTEHKRQQIVIVYSRFLQRPEKRSRGNQLIHRRAYPKQNR